MSLAKIRIFKASLFGLMLGNYIIILVDDTIRCINVTPRYYENLAKILAQKAPRPGNDSAAPVLAGCGVRGV